MKSLLEITSLLLQDCGRLCGVNPFRDLVEVTRRFEHEGASFLTITLPTFAAGLEKALQQGHWSPTLAPAFAGRRRGSLPRFLGGFLDQVFEVDGTIKEFSDEQARSIWAVRQICRAVSKLFVVAPQKRVDAALTKFLLVEDEVRNHVVSTDYMDTFVKVSHIILADVCGSSAGCAAYDELRPRHGPGTTAEGVRGNHKFDFRAWPLRLEREFPFTEFGVSSILNPDALERVSLVSYPLPRDKRPVRIVPVPKTAKTPRIIAIEPVASQFMQQAISDWLRPRVELRGRYTSGHVNFTDQKVNNHLARLGSRNGSLATIDMSDASDRVSCKHVAALFKVSPLLKRWAFACRSTRARLPDGKIFPLRKFASMGSALCFPVEALAFFVAAISSVIMERGCAVTPRRVYSISRGVYVYGDDIIVPTDVAPSVARGLELFGFKVNVSKSFWTGKFRESCGGDYYGGVDVTPVYLRRNIPSNRADVQGLVSCIETANQLYFAGLWSSARWLRAKVELILGALPSVTEASQVLGWRSFSNASSFHGWHHDFQRPKAFGYVVRPIRSPDPLDGDGALLKCLRLVGIETDREHLRSSVRFGNLALKRRWT